MADENIPEALLPELERMRTEQVIEAALKLVQANDRLTNAFCYVGSSRKAAMDKLMADQQTALNELRVALMATGRYSL